MRLEPERVDDEPALRTTGLSDPDSLKRTVPGVDAGRAGHAVHRVGKRYVIIRDDDTNALTPVDCLERLYRPFLDRGMPVNLAVIPEVSTCATMSDGSPEGFLTFAGKNSSPTVPIGTNPDLLAYLKSNPGFKVVQHGYRHDYLEFDRADASTASARLDRGADRLMEGGFEKPTTFVAPYDKLSRATLAAVGERFQVLSTGWFELRRLPRSWWAGYLRKKLRRTPHWRIGNTLLLSHPGCLLSCNHRRSSMLASVLAHLNSSPLTVLVTHWWEYFRNGQSDESFIEILHGIASVLSSDPDLEVISFSDLVSPRAQSLNLGL